MRVEDSDAGREHGVVEGRGGYLVYGKPIRKGLLYGFGYKSPKVHTLQRSVCRPHVSSYFAHPHKYVIFRTYYLSPQQWRPPAAIGAIISMLLVDFAPAKCISTIYII